MKSVDEIAKDHLRHFKEYEEEAREERRASVDWALVRKNCRPRQVLAIQVFVEHRSFEGVASITKIRVPNFMDLLQELKISMA